MIIAKEIANSQIEMGTRVIFLHFTGLDEVLDRILKLVYFSETNSSLNECLKLFTIFQVFQGLTELSDRFDGGSVLDFSVDHSQVKESFSISPIAVLEHLLKTLDCFFILNHSISTRRESFKANCILHLPKEL